jgi:hypothetical protein
MPLSDREQQILAQIESQLANEDPRFAGTLRTAPAPRGRLRLRVGIAGFAIGFLMLFAIVLHIAWGFVGFLLMLVSAVVVGNQLKGLGKDRRNRLGELKGGLSRYVENRRKPPPET